jgi:hypothetical protein
LSLYAFDVDETRALTKREREAIAFLLSPPDRRLEPLRVQAETAIVTGRCACGCATVYLAVEGNLPPARGLPSPAAIAEPKAAAPEHNWLMLWTKDGYLTSLEVSWVERQPVELPPLDIFGEPKVHA